MISRRPYVKIWEELRAEKSMILLAGPRQCGKTTLAKSIAEDFPNTEVLANRHPWISAVASYLWVYRTS